MTRPIQGLKIKVERHQQVVNAQGKEIWCCRFCSKEYMITGGTSVVVVHLKSLHNVDIKAKPEQRADGYENSILAAFHRPQTIEHKRRLLDNTTPIVPFDPKVLEYLYIRWIVACGIAYRMV